MMKKNILFVAMISLQLSALGAGTVGDAVTTFSFSGQPGIGEWYNGYLQSFYTNRIDIGSTIFPREYLATADSWLNDAAREMQSIQQATRKGLLESQMDSEGYLWAQQHGASSHDHGWPFPHWIQAPDWQQSLGTTAGWHFYDKPKGWEILYAHVRNVLPSRISQAAANAWEVAGFESKGINQQKNAWELQAIDGFPTLTSPAGTTLDSFNCPFVQIRWNVGKKEAPAHRPYMEWMCEGDNDWSESRRMEFYADWLKGRSGNTGMFHSILPLYQHPEWKGKVTRVRFCMDASDQPAKTFYVRSIFTAWDTRHLVNNAIYIKASFEYFRWTGDIDFLRKILPKLRLAMRYMMEEGHSLELNHIRCTWPGHDGRPGYTVNPDGTKTFHVGHGKGGNYWDLLPLGWDDMYTTTHYYASLLAMAALEETIALHPGWAMPDGLNKVAASFLREHAQAVKEETNQKFWNEEAGRFVGCIDADGVAHDYGFTFINLEALHYGIANASNALKVMEWIDGARIIEGDTSTGADIYAYQLAPRATTKRNVEWYAHAWSGPETLPFGGQVQDGGAVLGFSFYDIMSRIKTLGPDNAWERLMAIRAWDEEVAAYGGYRKYYGDGKGGTTLQGGGTAGGIGIDAEFTESSMLSTVVPLGFMGLQPDGNVLNIQPNLPQACQSMSVFNLKYQGALMDIGVRLQQVVIEVHTTPAATLIFRFNGQELRVDKPGTYTF